MKEVRKTTTHKCDIPNCDRTSAGVGLDGKDYCHGHSETFEFTKHKIVVKKTQMVVRVSLDGGRSHIAFYKAMIRFAEKYGPNWRIVKSTVGGNGAWMEYYLENFGTDHQVGYCKVPDEVNLLVALE